MSKFQRGFDLEENISHQQQLEDWSPPPPHFLPAETLMNTETREYERRLNMRSVQNTQYRTAWFQHRTEPQAGEMYGGRRGEGETERLRGARRSGGKVNVITALSPLYPISHYLPRQTLNKIFQTYAMPYFDYCGIIHHGYITTGDGQQLERLHNRAARLVTRPLSRRATHKLMTGLGWTSLKTRRDIHIVPFSQP